ncbi:CBASS system CD-NTase-associated NAD(+) hydrolase Cap12 [Gelidibacter maritimus]|nr:STING domain-containing protein [Gelidibacter maritimus]
MKKRIFIGSSSEELGTAKIVKSILDNDFEVIIWNESVWDKSVFKINNNFLSDLLTATLKFDFGILIGSPDDRLIYRGEEKLTARDNILFELGLFTGRLGLEKCAFLIEESVKVPSDLGGINLVVFNNKTLADKIDSIKEMFLHATNIELNFFPSSTLAYAYYENFVKYVCEHYVQNNGFIYNNNNYSDCKLKIIVPYKLPNDLNLAFKKIQNDIGVDKLSFSSNGRPRNVHVDAKVENGKLMLLDFPTTLTGIDYAIGNHLPNDFKNQTEDYNLIIEREINKFIDTLKKILLKNGFDDFVEIVRS